MIKDFEVLPHTADLKIRVYGDSLEQLFKHALIGMFQSIGPITETPGCQYKADRLVCDSLPKEHTIDISSFDSVSLLVDFLSEALYLSDVNNEAYLDVRFTAFSPTHLEGALLGVGIKGFEVVEIKAVTYHDLRIIEQDGRWQADIVFDV